MKKFTPVFFATLALVLLSPIATLAQSQDPLVGTWNVIFTSSSTVDPQWSRQNRPTVAMAKPANGHGPGLGCFTLQSPPPASLFLCASCVDRI